MLKSGQFHFFDEKGAVVRATIDLKTVASPEEALKRLSEENRIYIRNAFASAGFPVNLTVSGAAVWATIPLPFIRITCSYKAPDSAGISRPDFLGGSSDAVRMTCDWTTPPSMRAILLTKIQDGASTSPTAHSGFVYLAAFDADGKAYKLPLPNTYADGRLCTGWREDKGFRTVKEVVDYVLDMFISAPWNSDLFDRGAQADQLFRFKTEAAGLTTVSDDIYNNWRVLSAKMAAPHFNNVCL